MTHRIGMTIVPSTLELQEPRPLIEATPGRESDDEGRRNRRSGPQSCTRGREGGRSGEGAESIQLAAVQLYIYM